MKDVTLALPKGATLGIVGESGSGKSTLARCIVRLIEPDAGAIRLDGTDLAEPHARARCAAQTRNIQMVFQDPFASLNPRRKAGELVAQGLIVHGTPRARGAGAREGPVRAGRARSGSRPTAIRTNSPAGSASASGLRARSRSSRRCSIADEPVSALDVSVQAQVLKLLAELRARLGLSMVFITHDLRVAAQVCDLVAVMKDGEIVEAGPVAQVFAKPQHPYTQALLASVPGREIGTRLV